VSSVCRAIEKRTGKKIARQIEALNQIQYDKDVIKAKPIKAPTLMDSEHERPSGFPAPPKDEVRLQCLEFYASVAQAIHSSRFADENPNLIVVASSENIQKAKQLAPNIKKPAHAGFLFCELLRRMQHD
jgi:hypothetical protein